MSRPHVEIRRDGRSGFVVALSSLSDALNGLIPPMPFPDHGRASYAAMTLGRVAGWPIIDRTEGARQ